MASTVTTVALRTGPTLSYSDQGDPSGPVLVLLPGPVPARVWQEMFAEPSEYDDSSQLPRISAPALLIWGSADGVVNRWMQDQLHECIPHADLIVYEGLGHTPRWEDPIRFATDVSAFVERSLSAPS